MNSAAPATILVYVGLDLVGDGVMKLPFLGRLRLLYPDARITWLAGQGDSVFAASLAPLVPDLLDEVIERAGIGVSGFELWRRPLAHRRFDLLIDTQRRVMTSLILRRIRHRCFISAAADWRFSDRIPPQGRAKRPSMIGQMMALLDAASGTEDPTLPALILPPSLSALARERLPEGRIYVGLAPGAGGRHKCWPLERFTALAEALSAQGLTPVFLLGPAEQGWQSELKGQLRDAVFPLTPDDPPSVTIALAARLAVAIANDSGTGHMLAAGGAPMVSLFGPTSPDKFAPAAARLSVIRAQDFGAEMMTAIPQDAVMAALLSLLPRS